MKLLKHTLSGRIYPHTKDLEERSDMVPYEGPLPGHENSVPATSSPKTRAKAKPRAKAAVAQEEAARDAARARYEKHVGEPPADTMTVEQMLAAAAQAEAQAIFDSEQQEVPETDLPSFGD